MDADRFDALLGTLAGMPSRRQAVRLFTSVVLAGVLGRSDVVAKKKKKKKKRKKRKGGVGCAPACTGKTCGADGCGGTCGACGTGAGCVDGVCGCLEGFHSCRGSCLPLAACCTDNDCGAGRFCLDGICFVGQGSCDDGEDACTVGSNPCGAGCLCYRTVAGATRCGTTDSSFCDCSTDAHCASHGPGAFCAKGGPTGGCRICPTQTENNLGYCHVPCAT
jgi:hypothetical protein